MVGTIIPSLIAPEVVSVQPIDNRVGMINILEYQYGNDKGAARNGQTFASPLAYQGMDKEYTSSAVTDEYQTSKTVDGTVIVEANWGPVIPGTIIAQNANTGDYLTVDSIDGKNIVFNGLATDTDVILSYRYDNESVPVQSPQIKLNIKSLPVETKARKLSAIWAFDAQYELSKELTCKVA